MILKNGLKKKNSGKPEQEFQRDHQNKSVRWKVNRRTYFCLSTTFCRCCGTKRVYGENHIKIKDHPFFGMPKETNFANVDLDIYSRSPLESLAAVFGKKVILHYVGREKGRYSMHLCLNSDAKSSDTLIRSMVALVKKLPKPARKIWNNALSREFNIGIEAGTRPHAFELPIQTRTLEAVVQVNGCMGVTIYTAQV